jgi:peptidoglycan/xylan/chitin deacetylase (PgdA/CDA1 family)
MQAISLGYHDVVCNGGPPEFPPRSSLYTIRRESFCEHLCSIQRSAGRARVSSVDRLPAGQDEVPVLLTFDDGAACGYPGIAEHLESFGWRGHFFVITDWTGRPGFLNARQIRDLHERGHVVGTHSCSHPERMSHLGWRELLREWSDSCAALADIIGQPVTVASLPNGYYSRKAAMAAAASGLKVLFTSEPTSAGFIVDGCLVLGRYTIRRSTAAPVVAAIAAGAAWPRLRQQAAWSARTAAKRAAGPWYLTIRRLLVAHTSAVPK